jgi:prolipoprotein diacylglyceryl transferase
MPAAHVPLAYLPGPVSGAWHLGPVTVHGYALCVVLGVLALLWLAERRYRAAGGRKWAIVDLATVAVPASLIGARIYRIAVDSQRYFGHGRDWVGILRIWDGGLGLPGAAIAGVVAAWLWCRYHDLEIGPVLMAAAPGVAVGAAISFLGNLFAQSLYGSPSTAFWAVQIAPANRIAGYQDFGTFQPLFLYEAIWNVVIALVLIRLISELNLTGDRALAIGIGGYAVGLLAAEPFVLTGPQHHAVLLIKEIAAVAVLGGAIAYFLATRARIGPEPLNVRLDRGARRGRTGRGRGGRGRGGWGRGQSTAGTALPGGDSSQPSPNASRTAGEAARREP